MVKTNVHIYFTYVLEYSYGDARTIKVLYSLICVKNKWYYPIVSCELEMGKYKIKGFENVI